MERKETTISIGLKSVNKGGKKKQQQITQVKIGCAACPSAYMDTGRPCDSCLGLWDYEHIVSKYA